MMTAHYEQTDLFRENSVDTNGIYEPISTTTSDITTTVTTITSSVDESSSISPLDSAHNSSVNIAQVSSRPRLGTYVIDRTIGKGIFSVVKLATHTITGINLAIKIIDKRSLNAENLAKIYRESDILKTLHHPNIVKLFQVMETPRLLCIAMEFLPNGEVFDYIANHGRFAESEARVKFLDVLHAVDYIHSMGIVHRDIKAENLLFDAHMNIKLTDFSFGTRYFTFGSQALLTTWCGSPPYAAPEIFKGEPYVGTKADIWSLGVVLYVMVCGSLPFDAQPLPLLKIQVLSACFRVPYWLSRICERLLRSMLSKLPARRPSTQEIMCHPWITNSSVSGSDSTSSMNSCPALVNGVDNHVPAENGISEPPVNLNVVHSGLDGTMTDTNRSHSSLTVQLPSSDSRISNSAPDGEVGNVNDLVLLLMESLGMNRSQILESLERRAYDHLMATYLLLGEKLRRHRHNLPIGPLTTSSIGGARSMRQLDTPSSSNKPSCLGLEMTHAKCSRVDSAVDIKDSLSETEFTGTSVPTMSLPNAERPHESYACPSCYASDRPPPSTPWTSNLNSAALPTNPFTTTNAVHALRFPSYASAHPASNVPHDTVVSDNEPSLLQLQHSNLPYGSPDHLIRPSMPCTSTGDSNVIGPCAAAENAAPDITYTPFLVSNQALGVDLPIHPSDACLPVSDPSATQAEQIDLPCWIIHAESETNPVRSPVRRRTLVRRKYGVFTPPSLDQLDQAVLLSHSHQPVQETPDPIDEETG